jgi:hypothetical protein
MDPYAFCILCISLGPSPFVGAASRRDSEPALRNVAAGRRSHSQGLDQSCLGSTALLGPIAAESRDWLKILDPHCALVLNAVDRNPISHNRKPPMPFEPVIGLEVHAQLKTRTKIFCGCSTAFGAPPNTHTCPVCLGMPGVLPVLNKKWSITPCKMALATHCSINQESRFARKNYFYPDLPKGYQISQYELPIAEHGHIASSRTGKKAHRHHPYPHGRGCRQTDP